jgi:hypothetical protein
LEDDTMRHRLIPAAALTVALGFAGACGGGDGGPTPTIRPATVAPTDTPEPRPELTPRATPPPRTPGAAFTAPEAVSLTDAVTLLPDDLDVTAPWVVQTDNGQDNAAFAAAAPELASDVETCGRVFGRTVILQPEDIIGAFIGGETLSFFNQLTVYENAGGATTCSELSAQRLAEPGALARQFGDVFVDPAAVVVTPVDFPIKGDGSIAATLTGQSEPGGMPIELTILVVAFRRGNVTAAVGSVRSGTTPPIDELEAYVDLVLKRIEAWQ